MGCVVTPENEIQVDDKLYFILVVLILSFFGFRQQYGHVFANLQNVTFWRAIRCGLPKIAQKIQEKEKKSPIFEKKV